MMIRRRKNNDAAKLRAAYGNKEGAGYAVEGGPISTKRRVGRPSGFLRPLIRPRRLRRSDAFTSHRVGLGLERDLRIPLRQLQEALDAGRHRSDVQKRQVAVLANYVLRYNEIGVSKDLLADALSASESTIKRLIKDARKARRDGIDPWTGERVLLAP
jgi:hypothetical protein